MKYCASCQAGYSDDYEVCPRDQSPLKVMEDLAVGAVLRGKYELLEKLGTGGMSTVYRARHTVFDEICAVKVVSTQFADNPEFLQRIRNEAIITRRLRHPNAVRLDDFDFTEDGRPFLVMACVEGTTLRSILVNGPLAPVRAIRIARQVAAALAAAHKLGIVHRDIKPDNILVQPMPANSEWGNDIVRVLDFGIAMLQAGVNVGRGGYLPTKQGMVVGTPQYISPEQAMGKSQDEIDGRADLYSLGVVLFEMATGQLPFEADSAVAMLLQHIEAPPPSPADLNPELAFAPRLNAIVLKALQKEPAKRFQTADEMFAALEDPALVAEAAALGPVTGRAAAATAPTPQLFGGRPSGSGK